MNKRKLKKSAKMAIKSVKTKPQVLISKTKKSYDKAEFKALIDSIPPEMSLTKVKSIRGYDLMRRGIRYINEKPVERNFLYDVDAHFKVSKTQVERVISRIYRNIGIEAAKSFFTEHYKPLENAED